MRRPPDFIVPVPERSTIADVLRGRVLRGLRAGTLIAGDRLPSARELVSEFDTDHRLILAAYRQLADEGLVDVRERGGVYVGGAETSRGGMAALPAKWLVDTFTESLAREIPGPDLSEWLRRALETVRLHAVVISSTEDQVAGLARELRDDFGLVADGLAASGLAEPGVDPATLALLKRADVIIATEAHVELAERLSGQFAKPVLAVDVRSDLIVGEWAMLLRQPVWAIVSTPEFGAMLTRFFAGVRGVENLHVLVHGRDDLGVIPEGAPTYVTQRVRQALGDTPIRGRILPAARTLSTESERAIFDFIVRINLRARQAMTAVTAEPSPKRA